MLLSDTHTSPRYGGPYRSIWGRELCQELTRWRKRTPSSAAEGYAVSLRACGVVLSGLAGSQVRYAEDRGALVLVIHVSLSRAASFLGPQHREGADALFRFWQAQLSSSLGAFNFVNLKPSPPRRVSRSSTVLAFQALYRRDRKSYPAHPCGLHTTDNEAKRCTNCDHV